MTDRRVYFQSKLNAAEGDAAGLVGGMAVPYNQVGWFFGEAIVVAPGAAAKSLEARGKSKRRDVLALASHDDSRVLGRTSNSTLEFSDTADGLMYAVKLNLEDPDGVSAYQKVKRGEFTAASIGFALREGKEAVRPDNSEGGGGEEVEAYVASEIDVFEVSLVAQGVFGEATSRLAAARRLLPPGYAIVAAHEGRTAGEPSVDVEGGTAEEEPDSGGAGESGDAGGRPVAEAFAQARALGIL